MAYRITITVTTLNLAPVGGAIAADILLKTLAAHAIPGSERHAPPRHQRLIRTATGVHAVTVKIGPHEVSLDCDTDDPAVAREVAAAVHSWLDLDTDTTPITAHLSRDELLRPLVDANPGLRIPAYADGFEGTVMTIIGQQISLAAGRTFGRLVAAYGTPSVAGLIQFPTPDTLARIPAAELGRTVGLTTARAQSVSTIAEAGALLVAFPPGKPPGWPTIGGPGVPTRSATCGGLRLSKLPAHRRIRRRHRESL